MDRLTIHQTPPDDMHVLLLRLSGELDYVNICVLRDAVVAGVEEGGIHLRIDLSQITWCDNASLHSILGFRTALSATGGSLVVIEASPAVRAALIYTGLERLAVLAC
ncbi:STAS domain-containing protein [Streptomyces monticola]|uniref:STAS domain-containing protein n=1 Tax=Streptomyces monticola TaxID=2666263 RepID=A0ABW2JL35_9ACTN